ncbi:hypothetical protein [Paludisphaera mucosa]|uniref:Uncharacterized protein n=1 Tax=Paludisphaera mucosa TaxID=3030827 RepID=A0ABT6FGW3_9BACT|nr:hypothetical protein [Paludisphaera mucosa]MDG3006807.1 hypothetical protein [Paludisphaera mucosa]
MSSPRGATRRRAALWSALAMGFVLPTVGCQVEYAGMTLPSGKYMHDDVQYFAKGPEFPWANTQAATQRARMRAMGMDVPGSTEPITTQRSAPGTTPGIQRGFGNPTDVNASPLEDIPQPPNPGVGPGPDPDPVPAMDEANPQRNRP